MINYTYLFLGICYLFFIPGFFFVELLLPKLQLWKKIPLYLLLSVLISTYFTYFTSLLFGFTRQTLLIDLLIFVLLILFFRLYRNIDIKSVLYHKYYLIVAIVIYSVFYFVLNEGIFKKYGDNYIMSGPNWQDTAMHQSIIESISQGNFPPNAPYFSGQKLSYYYFSDLHSAILAKFYGAFFPSVFVLTNSLFAMLFYLCVYILTYSFSKNRIYSIYAGVGALFYGNLGFINLIKDTIFQKQNYFQLLTNNAYHLDFNTTLLMVPMVDYFLQNRPMMIGLPAVVVIVYLISEYFKSFNKSNLLITAGILTALLIKFQFFGFLVGVISFCVFSFVEILKTRKYIYPLLRSLVIFILPSILLFIVFGFDKVGDRSLVSVVVESFSFGPWEKRELVWYFEFLLNNLSVPFILFLFSFFYFLYKLFKDRKNINDKRKVLFVITLLTFLMIVIPFSVKFTIYDYDMFKFFYYCLPFIYVVIGYFLSILNRKNKLSILLSILIIIISSFTSINVLIHAYLNKSVAYSNAEYEVGIWIRKNVPQKSVFITYPSVHSPVSDIAGRLRILSYINWPYSHGFNSGDDNVFSRDRDIIDLYNNGDNLDKVDALLNKYSSNYIYLGSEELSNFTEAENKLKSNNHLEVVYDKEGIKIFKRIQNN